MKYPTLSKNPRIKFFWENVDEGHIRGLTAIRLHLQQITGDFMTIMKLEEIPFMHWGIITKYNFSPEYVRYIPRKRWDPLTSVEIKLYDEITRQLVGIGKRKGHFSYISPIRGKRPKGEKVVRDVFQKIITGEDHAIFIAIDDKVKSDPFSLTPELLNVENSKAVTIVNRFPATVRYIDREILEKVRPLIEDEFTRIAFGINLITFPTRYYETLSDAHIEDLVAMFKSVRTAINKVAEVARKRGIDLLPVYPFFNIGPMAGGSQPRLHSQVYIDLNLDGHGALMENILQAFDEMRNRGICYLCTSKHNSRIVYENSTWIVWTSLSPRRNYHLRLAPKRHVEIFTELDDFELEGLSDALIRVSRGLDKLNVERNRNVLIYSNPIGYNSIFHLYIDFIPFEKIGGIEMLDSCRVARIAPEDVAAELRNVVKEI